MYSSTESILEVLKAKLLTRNYLTKSKLTPLPSIDTSLESQGMMNTFKLAYFFKRLKPLSFTSYKWGFWIKSKTADLGQEKTTPSSN